MGKTKSTVQPIKAKPVLQSDLERYQAELKLYSPAQKPYERAVSPKVGEVWKPECTLDSGLNFGMRDIKPKNKLVYVFRYFLGFSRELVKQHWETKSISWHPTKEWLVTSGIGNNAKLWDAKNGNMITENPLWDTESNGTTKITGKTLSWSYDGTMFISFNNSYDGKTGERLIRNLLQESSGYSNQDYSNLRVREYKHDGYSTSSPFCSTNNFSPWRPNSEQFINGHSEENLIIHNRNTNEIEKIIDCVVHSTIKDFAWHPRGRFIAVTFKEHNVRIIDIDEAKIIDDLSVQNLVGWSPDGKILVAREDKNKDDFVIWDALKTEERPMPEEMKNKLWFKRFSKNISADGFRYIKVENVENGKGNIYSLESDELLFTLPKKVTSAAWSPIDGGLLATCGGSETHIWRL